MANSGRTTLGKLGCLSGDIIFKRSGHAHIFAFERELVDPSVVTNSASIREASEHVTRLWANADVLRLAGKREIREAIALATGTHIVTPYSGAVVLETKEQFQRAGLTPVEAAQVPVVPEPGTWVLLLFGLVLICAKSLAQRKLPF